MVEFVSLFPRLLKCQTRHSILDFGFWILDLPIDLMSKAGDLR